MITILSKNLSCDLCVLQSSLDIVMRLYGLVSTHSSHYLPVASFYNLNDLDCRSCTRTNKYQRRRHWALYNIPFTK